MLTKRQVAGRRRAQYLAYAAILIGRSKAHHLAHLAPAERLYNNEGAFLQIRTAREIKMVQFPDFLKPDTSHKRGLLYWLINHNEFAFDHGRPQAQPHPGLRYWFDIQTSVTLLDNQIKSNMDTARKPQHTVAIIMRTLLE